MSGRHTLHGSPVTRAALRFFRLVLAILDPGAPAPVASPLTPRIINHDLGGLEERPASKPTHGRSPLLNLTDRQRSRAGRQVYGLRASRSPTRYLGLRGTFLELADGLVAPIFHHPVPVNA
jgi:hypothetical protein